MSKSPKELLDQFNGNMPKLLAMAPEAGRAFVKQLMPAILTDGALDLKQKELIALGIAIASRCDYCIAIHVKKSLEAGATKEEIGDACGVAMLMGGGPALTYASFVAECVEEFGG